MKSNWVIVLTGKAQPDNSPDFKDFESQNFAGAWLFLARFIFYTSKSLTTTLNSFEIQIEETQVSHSVLKSFPKILPL